MRKPLPAVHPSSPDGQAPFTTWTITTDPPVGGGPAWGARVLRQARALLIQRLEAQPMLEEVLLATWPVEVRARRTGGSGTVGAEIRLRFQDDGSAGRV